MSTLEVSNMSNPESDGKLPDTISLEDEEAVKRLIMETIFGMWTAVNNLTRLSPAGGSATG